MNHGSFGWEEVDPGPITNRQINSPLLWNGYVLTTLVLVAYIQFQSTNFGEYYGDKRPLFSSCDCSYKIGGNSNSFWKIYKMLSENVETRGKQLRWMKILRYISCMYMQWKHVINRSNNQAIRYDDLIRSIEISDGYVHREDRVVMRRYIAFNEMKDAYGTSYTQYHLTIINIIRSSPYINTYYVLYGNIREYCSNINNGCSDRFDRNQFIKGVIKDWDNGFESINITVVRQLIFKSIVKATYDEWYDNEMLANFRNMTKNNWVVIIMEIGGRKVKILSNLNGNERDIYYAGNSIINLLNKFFMVIESLCVSWRNSKLVDCCFYGNHSKPALLKWFCESSVDSGGGQGGPVTAAKINKKSVDGDRSRKLVGFNG